MKVRNYMKNILLFLFVSLYTILLLKTNAVSFFNFFNIPNMLIYLGMLMISSLLIYTFLISIISSIKQKLDNVTNGTPVEKKMWFDNIVNAYDQIKKNIQLVFFCLIVLLGIGVVEKSFIFYDNIYLYISYSFVFILSTNATYDLMVALFIIAEIQIALLRDNNQK